MKKIVVSSECIACGLCTATDKYLQEDNVGQAVPIPGKLINDSELNEVNDLISNCPAKALSLVEVKNAKSKKDFIAAAIKKLSEIDEMEKPKQSDFPYNSSELSVPYYGATGQYSYNYSSNSSANSAAEREFNSRAYSQMKPFALKLVMQYKSKYLAPYYVAGATSVYEKKNTEIEKILAEISGELESMFGEELSPDFVEFDVLPDTSRDSMLDMLRKDTVFADEVAERISNRHRSEYPLSSYSMYWDVDYEEKYVGKGVFGDKYKTMYCYSGVEVANEHFAKDMLYIAGYIDINITAYDKACVVVSEYNTNFKKAIEEKIAILKSVK